jgi:5-methyltetrahydrofolate--homocysteine methyltransferase
LDIILTNNGYQVHNLGIIPIAHIVDAFKDVKADAIGMSGLLVKRGRDGRESARPRWV